MPEPIITPVRQRASSSCGAQPESATASSAATSASWMNRSIFFWSLMGIHSEMSRPPSALVPAGTWPAIFAGRAEVSKDWMLPMPDSPASIRFHTCSTPRPSGQAMPMPVTTTRRGEKPFWNTRATPQPRPWALLALLLLDVVDRVLHGRDLLGGVVGDLDAEGLLEGHDQLDRVEAVGAQVIDEGGFGGDLRLF